MRLPFALALAILSLGSAIADPAAPSLNRTTTRESVALSIRSRFRSALPTRRNGIYPGRLLVKLRPSVTEKIARAATSANQTSLALLIPSALRSAQFQNQVYKTGWAVWDIPADANVPAFCASLRRDPEILAAQPLNRIYRLIPEPNDADWNFWERQSDGSEMVPLGDGVEFRRLWYVDDIGAFEGWSFYASDWFDAATKPTDGPLIAIIDTGCDMDHPDFINAGGTGTDISEGGQFDKGLSKQFVFGEIVPDGSTEDTLGHGTHVTGLALAAGNNGAFAGGGIIGTGFACRGMIIRVFDDNGNGSDADAAAAIFYAADNGASVINLSLGTENFSLLFQEAVTYALQKGCVVVAAGNEDGAGGGDLGPIYPAACAGAIAVTANGPNGIHASDYYAGTGMYIDVAAPGGDAVIDIADPENPRAFYQYMYSTTMRGPNPILAGGQAVGYHENYGYLIGTSMASPVVSGGLGMYFGFNGLTPDIGGANLRAMRSLQRSALSVYGAPKGSWETYQGFGCFLLNGLLVDYDTRESTAGSAEGIVRVNGVPTANVAVRAKKDGSAVNFSTTTRADGIYRFDQLPPGNFTITAAAGATPKSKRAIVVAGSEAMAIDFWCGTFSGDETPPVVRKFAVEEVSANQLLLRQWGYDPETGIDKFTVQIGTSPGASDLMPPTEVLSEYELTPVTIPTIDPRSKIYVTGSYRNGNGDVTTASAENRTGKVKPPPSWSAAYVRGRAPSSVSVRQHFRVNLLYRNTGSQPWHQSGRGRFTLRSANPTGSSTWGTVVVRLPKLTVAPGESVVLTVDAVAPSTPGTYNFQFGPQIEGLSLNALCPNVAVAVR